MKIVIIEDEIHAARKLERQIMKVDGSIEILAHIQTVDEAVNWLNSNKADLIFLDIHLGDALSFEIFDKVEVTTPIIFTTAFDKYAIKAFKLNSIDYLLKPVKREELESSINKFKSQSGSQQPINFSDLVGLLKTSKGDDHEFQKRFMVYKGEKIESIFVDQISYFFAEGKYCYLITYDGNEYLIDFTLGKLEQVLNPEFFFRINRQYYLSIKSIKEMFSYSKGRIKILLTPPRKEDVIVSVERSSEFKKWLNR